MSHGPHGNLLRTLTDLEPLRSGLVGRLAIHARDTRGRRSDPQPLAQGVERLARPAGEDLDAPVGQVAGIAVHTQRQGLAPRRGAEADALNPSGDQAMDADGQCLATRAPGFCATLCATPWMNFSRIRSVSSPVW